MNSLVIVLFLSGMVAMIMLRTLHKDIARYNQMDSVVRASLSEMELLVLFKSTKSILLLLAGCRVWWGETLSFQSNRSVPVGKTLNPAYMCVYNSSLCL